MVVAWVDVVGKDGLAEVAELGLLDLDDVVEVSDLVSMVAWSLLEAKKFPS